MPSSNFNTPILSDYQSAKESIILKIISAEDNKEILPLIPHELLDDLAVTYRSVFKNDSGRDASLLITNEDCEAWGITSAQLQSDATDRCAAMHPAYIRNMENVLFGIKEEDPGGLWVISNDTGEYGAAVIAYPGMPDKIAEKLGGGYYLLPSSVHEMIAISDANGIRAGDLDRMVLEVNSTEVLPEERLADHCYHYDPEVKLFESGKSYEERTGGYRR